AWRDVESASQKFETMLNEINSLPGEEDPTPTPQPILAGEQSPKPEPNPSGQFPSTESQQNAQSQKQSNLSNLLTLRNELDLAAKKLTESVPQSQSEALRKIAVLQENAAKEIMYYTYVALLMGMIVASLTFMLARSQILDLRQANQLEQEAKDFAG